MADQNEPTRYKPITHTVRANIGERTRTTATMQASETGSYVHVVDHLRIAGGLRQQLAEAQQREQEAKAELEQARAALATPEVYVGVVSEALERERDHWRQRCEAMERAAQWLVRLYKQSKPSDGIGNLAVPMSWLGTVLEDEDKQQPPHPEQDAGDEPEPTAQQCQCRSAGDFLDRLRDANTKRAKRWNPNANTGLEFDMNELAGEVGEACNAAKKIARARHGMRGGSDQAFDHGCLADELADVIITADLAAAREGINLKQSVINKFNATSKKHDLGIWIESEAQDGQDTGAGQS